LPDSPPSRKKRFWEVDPAVFRSSGKYGIRERVADRVRQAGKSLAWLLLFTYPLTLPLLGLLYGGLVFWGTFAGTVIVMMILLSKFGYGRTFGARDFPFFKSLVGLSGAFLCTLGLYLSLAFLKFWTIPIAFGLSALAFGYFLRRQK
jgi:hypothetical protein